MTKRIFVSSLHVFFAVGCLAFVGCVASAEDPITRGNVSGVSVGNAPAACGLGAADPQCPGGSVCTRNPGSTQGFCRSIAQVGQRCGVGTKPLCQNGLICSNPPGGEGICRARATLGKACGDTNPPCAQGLFCDMTADVSTCIRG